MRRVPEIDEERLPAFATAGELQVDRVTRSDTPPPLELTWPDGRQDVVTMTETEGGPGHFAARVPASGSGLVRLRSGDLTTVAALGPINPMEYADLRPTPDVLDPFVDATNGGLFAIGDGPGAAIALTAGDDALLARVTSRAGAALDLREGAQIYAILKATTVAPSSIGR